MRLSVQLAPRHPRGLLLQNPVMTASGLYGYGVEASHLLDFRKLGAFVCKGTTLEPRPGNPPPRLVETPAGVLNSIGLQNIGIKALIEEKAPLWSAWPIPVIVNIAGETVKEYGEIARLLDGVSGVSALEVNIGCPNVEAGGMEFGARPEAAAAVTRAVKEATGLPVIVKLTPNVTDITEIARAVAGAGADALCLINTLLGLAIDIGRRRPYLGRGSGGLSGPAIRPVALHMVYRVARVVRVPVIGCGGIMSGEDALEFLMAGASAVQVGTASFVDPQAALRVLEGIEKFMAQEGVDDIGEIIGAAQRPT